MPVCHGRAERSILPSLPAAPQHSPALLPDGASPTCKPAGAPQRSEEGGGILPKMTAPNVFAISSKENTAFPYTEVQGANPAGVLDPNTPLWSTHTGARHTRGPVASPSPLARLPEPLGPAGLDRARWHCGMRQAAHHFLTHICYSPLPHDRRLHRPAPMESWPGLSCGLPAVPWVV